MLNQKSGKFLERFDRTVRELWMGIFFWGILGELLLLLFFRDRLGYHSLGLWCGALMAMAAAFHMWRALDTALEPGLPAEKLILKHSIVRYGAVIVLFGVIMATEVMNPLTAFWGLMGLKMAAYLQPLIHKRVSGNTEEREKKKTPDNQPG